MAKIKFGRGQLKQPTPSGVNFWVRVFSIIASVVMVWLPNQVLLHPATRDALASILALTTGIANAIAPLFGVPVTGKVDAEDVSAIDEPTPDKP